MIPSDPAASLQLYLKTQPSPLQVVNEASPDVRTLFTVGEQIQATVKGELPNGRFAVEVKNQLLDLNLPRNTQPGEQLQLKVLGNEPKLTLQLLGKAPPPQAPQITQGSNVQLSQGAVLVDTLSSALQKMGTSISHSVETKPLVEHPIKESGVLPQKLHEAISNGGAFYESHQAEWVTGQRNLSDLQNDPKSHIQQLKSDPAILPPESQPIVKQQLDILDQRAIVWHGLAWPGQPLNMLIKQETRTENEENGSKAANDPDSTSWRTELQLSLPSLGDLHASIQLASGKFKVHMSSDSEASIAALQHHAEVLRARFETAGLTLNGIFVQSRPHEK